MKRLNYILKIVKYSKEGAKLFNYYRRGKWGREFNVEYNKVFKIK